MLPIFPEKTKANLQELWYCDVTLFHPILTFLCSASEGVLTYAFDQIIFSFLYDFILSMIHPSFAFLFSTDLYREVGR